MSLIGCILILGVVLFLLYYYIFNKKLTTKMILMSFIILSYSIIILCLSLNPPEPFDLYRYFEEMNYIRTLDFTNQIKFIFLKPNFLWFAFETLATNLCKNNHFIFILSVPITTFIFYYILLQIRKDYKLTDRQVIISIFSYFSIISTIHIMSGIRNALAMSIYALGMYISVLKHKKIGYLFYLISLLIHPMVIIFFIFQILSKLLFKIKIKIRIGHYIVLLWSVFSKGLLEILKLLLTIIPISMLELYVTKLGVELTLKNNTDYRIIIPELIQIILITIVVYISMKKDKKFDSRLLQFYYLGFFIIGSISMFSIFSRTRFIFAYFLPFIFGSSNKLKTTRTKKSKNSILEHLILIISLYINFYYIYYMYCNGIFV